MNRQLPDVNVLLALLWPSHEGHAAANSWFTKSGQKAWATNPLTQLGLLRLLTNPTVAQAAVSAAMALEALSEATSHPGHEFWPLDFQVTGGLKPLAGRLQGHQQWTDALLLRHAAEHDGILVTFDSGLKQLAAGELSSHLLLLKHR